MTPRHEVMTGDQASLILYRLGEQDKKLESIEGHLVEHNGRLRKVEQWKAELQGARKLGSGLAGYIAPVVTGVITALIVVAILGHAV